MPPPAHAHIDHNEKHVQEVLARLQGCAGPEEVVSLLTERQRELEEGMMDLEYRMQEKDGRLDEVGAYCVFVQRVTRDAGWLKHFLHQTRPARHVAAPDTQLEAQLAQSRATNEALREEVRRLSMDNQHWQAEAQRAEERHAMVLAGKEQEMRSVVQGAKVGG